jgi:hypothetical protein
MATLRSLAAIAAFGSSLGAAVSVASAQATCDWYANTALQQQKVNADRKCGFKGESWSFDRMSHMQWCQSVSPDQWKRQAQLREQELNKCVSESRR